MKNTILFLGLIVSFAFSPMSAQNRATVNAMNNEISENLDLRAVASIFGDSRNLEDFERRLNDPEFQISNLDLNNDNEVDYLRVIETVEHKTHLVIIQSVLDRDVYQDVATIDIERNHNSVHVQFVGNEYLYGPNYIYEPVYYNTPQIYASFWVTNYRPYVSMWYWNYYPSYYYAWNPFPIYRYRNNISLCLNLNNRYNYVNYRRSNLAYSLYNTRRSNAYERRYPNYAFNRRYSNYTNRYDLDRRRGTTYYSSNRYTTGRTYNNSNSTARRGNERYYSSSQNNTNSRLYSSTRSNSRDYSNQSSTSKPYDNSRNYSQNNTNRNNNYSGGNINQERTSRQFSQNRNQNFNHNSNTRNYSPRQENNSQKMQTPRESSSNRGIISRPSAPTSTSQSTESSRSRNINKGNNNSSSRANNRRI